MALRGAAAEPVSRHLISLRAALTEERSRLHGLLGEIDETLDCLGSGGEKEAGEATSFRVKLANSGTDIPGLAPVPEDVEDAKVVASARPSPQGAATPAPAWDSSTSTDSAPDTLKVNHPGSKKTLNSNGYPRTTKARTANWNKDNTRSRRSMRARASDVMQTAVGQRSLKRQGRGMFADVDEMKEQVKRAVMQPGYDLKDLYSDQGWVQAVARHPLFELTSLIAILANGVWLAVETDHNDKAILVQSDPVFIVVENLFCTYFVVELAIRFFAFNNKLHALRDSWLLFDAFLVVLMVMETWIISVIVLMFSTSATTDLGSTSVLKVVRLVRLTRAVRVARLLKAVPELMVIGRGIVIVARTVLVILCLLVMLVYTFAIVFTQLAKGTDLENTLCPDMLTTMGVLLLGGILPDFSPTTKTMAAEDMVFAVFFFVFVLLAYVTIMNMLIGVLVEVVSVVASVEKETNQVASVKRVLVNWAAEGDKNGDIMIGKAEFHELLSNSECAKDLSDVGVDAVSLIEHAELFFRHTDALTFSELLSHVLGLRVRNDTKVHDLVQLRKFLHMDMQRIETSLAELRNSVQRMSGSGGHGPTRDRKLAERQSTGASVEGPLRFISNASLQVTDHTMVKEITQEDDTMVEEIAAEPLRVVSNASFQAR